MNKEKFLKLSKSCDELFNNYKNDKHILLLPSLHIVNEHPKNIQRFNNIINENFLTIIFNIFFSFFIYFSKSIKNIFTNKSEYFYLAKNRNNRHYRNIFVSHFVNLNEFQKKNDLYFKNMPNISSNHFKTLVVLINHTKINFNKRKNFFSKKEYDVIILSNNLKYKDKLNIFINSKRIFLKILLDILLVHKKNNRIIMFNALSNIFRDNSQFNLRFYEQIKKILTQYKPKNIFFTYEGHTWEKILCLIVKESLINSRSIGYQHSRFFRYQCLAKKNLRNEIDPDIILTSGKISCIELSKSIKNKEIVNIGKPCEEKFTLKLTNNHIQSKIRICVIPEGILEECYKLLKFSLSLAKENKNIFFIWRFHPLTNFKKLNKKINFYTLPANISVSKNSLNDDLKVSNMALYRGSSSILQAMKHGLIPIYLKIKNEIDIDIMNEKKEWHIVIENINEFNKKINKVLLNKKIKNMQKEIVNYSKNYYSDFNEKKFKEFL